MSPDHPSDGPGASGPDGSRPGASGPDASRPGTSGSGTSSPGSADPDRLLAHVRALQGVRHPDAAPGALERAKEYLEEHLAAAGLDPVREPFIHRGRTYENVVARLTGRSPDRPRVLLGAHFDTVCGTPGADDNASGVAGLLEAARLLASRDSARFDATIELVGFNLEELQGWTYRVGSRAYVTRAREEGVEYAGALVLEMIGYRDPREGSQRIPWIIRWMDLPRTGDFLAVTGDRQSRHLLELFTEAAADAAPDLPLVPFRSPLRGWVVWQTRLSDNASFWSRGYPALMITDTAFLRNPHYHRATDRVDTLDADFMAAVTDATVEAVRRMAGGRSGLVGGPGGHA